MPPAGTPKPTRQILEEALVADPDDRPAHAAYADLLLEEGDARGEFIRIQMVLEDEGLPPEGRRNLQQREQELLEAHQREWLGGLTPFLLGEVEPPDWLESLYGFDRIARFRFRWGWLDQLHIHHLSLPFARTLQTAPECQMLRELTIDAAEDTDSPREPGDGIPADYRAYDVGFFPLSRSAFLGNVRRLRLGIDQGDDYQAFNCHMRPAAMVPLVAGMPKIEELHLFCNGFNPTELFRLPALSNLRFLQLYHMNRVHRLHALAENPAVRNLTHLLFHPHHIEGFYRSSDEADGYLEAGGYLPLPEVRPLLHSPNLPHLTHLRLRVSSMGDEGCEEIVRSGILKRLKTLDLRHGRITERGARILAACPDLRNLEWLDLDRNAINQAGIDAIKATGVKVRIDDQHHESDAVIDGRESYEIEYLREGEFE